MFYTVELLLFRCHTRQAYVIIGLTSPPVYIYFINSKFNFCSILAPTYQYTLTIAATILVRKINIATVKIMTVQTEGSADSSVISANSINSSV